MERSSHVIIGAGHTGIFLAKQLAALGHKVLLIEQLGVGGSHVFHTDLPASILLEKSLDFAHSLKFFKDAKERHAELSAYREKIFAYTQWSIRQKSAQLEKELNQNPRIALLKGKAKFIKRNTLEIFDLYSQEYKLLEFDTCYITAGKNCLAGLQVKGVQDVPVSHKWNYWQFPRVPESIGLVGFSAETLEKADFYSNFGIKVEIFEARASWECLEQMDLTATNYLLKALMAKGVEVNFESRINKVLYLDEKFNLYLEGGYQVTVDQLYVPSREIINGDYLNLEALKIKYTQEGIKTNYKGHTNNSTVYAFGSVVDPSCKPVQALEKFLKFKQLRANRSRANPIVLASTSLTTIQGEVQALSRRQQVPELRIGATNTVLTVGDSEAVIRLKKGFKPKTEVFSHPGASGFVKIIYHPKTNKVLGFSSGGELSKQYGSFLKYAYSKKLKLREITDFLKFDMYAR